MRVEVFGGQEAPLDLVDGGLNAVVVTVLQHPDLTAPPGKRRQAGRVAAGFTFKQPNDGFGSEVVVWY